MPKNRSPRRCRESCGWCRDAAGSCRRYSPSPPPARLRSGLGEELLQHVAGHLQGIPVCALRLKADLERPRHPHRCEIAIDAVRKAALVADFFIRRETKPPPTCSCRPSARRNQGRRASMPAKPRWIWACVAWCGTRRSPPCGKAGSVSGARARPPATPRSAAAPALPPPHD